MTTDPTVVDHDLSRLAPNFAAGLLAAIAECGQTSFTYRGSVLAPSLDVTVFEGYRSGARQTWLYAQGRTRPGPIVTNAKTNLTSWHGYALAADVVHRTKFWEPFGSDKIAANRQKNEAWFAAVAAVFKKHGCNWGGDWTKPDTPHMQWRGCTASPSQGAIDLVRTQGIHAVWEKLGASGP